MFSPLFAVSRLLPVLLLLAGSASHAQMAKLPAVPPVTAGQAVFTGAEARTLAETHLGILAADDMQGRLTASPGERRAGEYLAAQLAAMGVMPGGDVEDGVRTYFQIFPLRTAAFERARTRFEMHGLGEGVFGTDWMALPEYSPNVSFDTLNVVFAGYGLSAPEIGHDDYKGINPVGRAVVIMGGSPEGIDSLATMAGVLPASHLIVKWLTALQQGAAAVILVNDASTLENWDHYSAHVRSTAMQGAGQQEMIPPAPMLSVSDAYGRRLLAAIGLPDSIVEDAEARRRLASTSTRATVGMELKVERGATLARNVVGIVPGTDLADEYFAYGAHYDHNGVIDGEIYNGADDNASGTTVVLNLADAFARDRAAGHGTRRSMLFTFFSGEEQGLLGSDYFTSNIHRSGIDDIRQIVGHVNLDMVGRESLDSLYSVGSYRLSEDYGRLVEDTNARLGENGRPLFVFDRAFDDPNDPENIFERSDHFNFAKHGIPVVFFTDGMGANHGKGLPGDDYHKPSDTAEKISYEKVVRVGRLAYAIGRAVGDSYMRFD
jgi:hypothetical protein